MSIAIKPLRKIRRNVYGLGSARSCPLCGWTGLRFLRFGDQGKRRSDASCPRCGSAERHRLAKVLLDERLNPQQRTLHVAPEPSVTPWIEAISEDYLSVDLEPGRAMRSMDLTRLDLPDSDRTLVFASHVLEHIPDDIAAMSEIRRVLTPGGLAIVQVPIKDGATDEDPTVTDPTERQRRFMQDDHVRFYGRDIVQRLESSGFQVETLASHDLSPRVVRRYALDYWMTREIFVCRAI